MPVRAVNLFTIIPFSWDQYRFDLFRHNVLKDP
jgi:hypothetical protein